LSSHFDPGSSGRFAVSFRSLFCAALIALASLAAAAPAAWADDPLATTPADSSQTPVSPTGGSSDQAGGTSGGSTTPAPDPGATNDGSTPSSSPDPVATDPTPPPPPDQTPTSTPADTASGNSQAGGSPTQNSGSASGTPAREPDSSTPHAAGQTSSGSSSIESAVTIDQGTSGPSSGGVLPVAPGTPAVTDIFDTLTGGYGGETPFLLSNSLGCTLFCYGRVGALGVATSQAQAQQAARDHIVSEAIKDAPTLLPGGTGQAPGQSFNIFGGAGGSSAALILLSLCALLAAMPMRSLSWTKLRLPAEMWPPSAYVPPIESPG
jgi:hypothetical protein